MHSIEHLIDLALQEDIGSGDITTESLIDPSAMGSGSIIAKESFVLAGMDTAKKVFLRLDPSVLWKPFFKDGDLVESGETVLEVSGRLRALLMGERTALNFLQRLSGIATHVRNYLEQMDTPNIRLVDTRKTTPGWRLLEKYAVRAGGAFNHRMGLYDGVLIKDNHIAACGSITKAVTDIRKTISHLVRIEVEVTDLKEVEEALAAGADVIMLDNMDIEQMKAAVNIINKRALVEISGGVTKDRLKKLAETGVDIISVGALTHSAKSVDMSMRIEQAH
jgi:nicotinate-nucleotide pyrophosphorylase (carboxylating)